MKTQIRTAQEKDIPQLVNLLTILFSQDIEFVPDEEKQEKGLQEILNSPSIGEILVIEMDEKVIGMFDFDWAKMDTRCFDVSLAVNYFCSSWEGSQGGHLLLDRVETFLDAYQETAQARGGLGALNDLELQCFPEMLMMSNFSIIDWTVKDFYKAKPDPDEYETYLRHNVRLLQWLERNRDMLAGSIQTYRQ